MSETTFGKRTVSAVESTKETSGAVNPALSPEEKLGAEATKRTRIPMSAPKAKLSTPEIPGFHLHWINDYVGRVQQAIAGGYEFVKPEETMVNNFSLSGGEIGTGTDMGTRVSVVVGKDDNGHPLRAYLMKQRNEWYEEDQAATQDRVDALHEGMRQGKQQEEQQTAYVKRVQMKSTYSRRG